MTLLDSYGRLSLDHVLTVAWAVLSRSYKQFEDIQFGWRGIDAYINGGFEMFAPKMDNNKKIYD